MLCYALRPSQIKRLTMKYLFYIIALGFINNAFGAEKTVEKSSEPTKIIFLRQTHLGFQDGANSEDKKVLASQLKILEALQQLKKKEPDFLLFSESFIFSEEQTKAEYRENFFEKNSEIQTVFESFDKLPMTFEDFYLVSLEQKIALVKSNYGLIGFKTPNGVVHCIQKVLLSKKIHILFDKWHNLHQEENFIQIFEEEGGKSFLTEMGADFIAHITGLIESSHIRPTQSKELYEKGLEVMQKAYETAKLGLNFKTIIEEIKTAENRINSFKEQGATEEQLKELKETLSKMKQIQILYTLKIQERMNSGESPQNMQDSIYRNRELLLVEQISLSIKNERPNLIVIIYGADHKLEETFKEHLTEPHQFIQLEDFLQL
jgi:hypothetical protein